MNYEETYVVISYPPHLQLLYVAQGNGWRPKRYYHGLTVPYNGPENAYTDEDYRGAKEPDTVFESAAAIIKAFEAALQALYNEDENCEEFEYKSPYWSGVTIRSTTGRIEEFIAELRTLGRDEVVFEAWD